MNDAMQYAKNDFGAKFEINENQFTFQLIKDEPTETTNDHNVPAD